MTPEILKVLQLLEKKMQEDKQPGRTSLELSRGTGYIEAINDVLKILGHW
jgi:hypothetical protein